MIIPSKLEAVESDHFTRSAICSIACGHIEKSTSLQSTDSTSHWFIMHYSALSSPSSWMKKHNVDSLTFLMALGDLKVWLWHNIYGFWQWKKFTWAYMKLPQNAMHNLLLLWLPKQVQYIFFNAYQDKALDYAIQLRDDQPTELILFSSYSRYLTFKANDAIKWLILDRPRFSNNPVMVLPGRGFIVGKQLLRFCT